jgi:hypothetical protein
MENKGISIFEKHPKITRGARRRTLSNDVIKKLLETRFRTPSDTSLTDALDFYVNAFAKCEMPENDYYALMSLDYQTLLISAFESGYRYEKGDLDEVKRLCTFH